MTNFQFFILLVCILMTDVRIEYNETRNIIVYVLQSLLIILFAAFYTWLEKPKQKDDSK